MLSVLLLLAGCNHPPELELPRELGPDLAETVQDRAAGVQQARLGRHLAVSLDAQEELGHVRVRNYRKSSETAAPVCCAWRCEEGI